MNILAFDTSMSACSLALLHNDRKSYRQQIAPMQQTRLVLPMIKALLEESELTVSELDGIAYTCGPASFTGIRISSSVAQGLSYPYQHPIIQISTLTALAQTAYELNKEFSHFLVLLDAYKEQVYWAAFKADAEGVVILINSEQISRIEEIDSTPEYKLLQEIHSNNWCGVGDGWTKYAHKLPFQAPLQVNKILSTLIPSPEALLTLAISAYHKGHTIPAIGAIPVYLR